MEEKLFQIINHRHNEILPTVITSRINLSEKNPNINISNQFTEPIVSRFKDGLVVTEIDSIKFLSTEVNLRAKVVLPAPEGEEIINMKPALVIRYSKLF